MAKMNREQALREAWRCIAKIKAIQADIREAVTRWEEQLKFIRDGVRDVQIKLDKLREEMDA